MLKNLIIFAVILLTQRVRAELDRDLIDRCWEETSAQLELSNNCQRGLEKIEDTITEIQTMLSEGGNNRNPNHIRWYSNKMCTYFDRSLNCTAYKSDLNEPCLSFKHMMVASERISLNVSRALLDYVCQSQGQIFLDIAQYDVGDVLKDMPRTCQFRKQQFEDPNASRFRINPAFCESVQEVFVCFANQVNNNPNQNLRRIVREVYDIIISELKC